MRPNQQNRRMRGRGNRKGPNPLTRSYESNGPDVKIRGTAQQIADKYTALARDAQGSGDRVIAENYLQHAEHYNRIIAAAQAQQQPAKENRDDQDVDDELDQDAKAPTNDASDERSDDGSGPQPVINGTPAEVALEEQSMAEDGAKGEGAAAAKPRRARRPRRETAKAADGTADEGNAAPESASQRSEKPEEDQPLAAAGS